MTPVNFKVNYIDNFLFVFYFMYVFFINAKFSNFSGMKQVVWTFVQMR